MKWKILYLVAFGLGLLAVQFVAWGGGGNGGRAFYLRYCASCHGVEGKGNGPVSPFLKIAPADLTQIRKNNRGIFPLARVMATIDGTRFVRAHGERQMPVWGEVFKQEVELEKYEERATLLKIKIIAEYVSSLQG